MKKGSDIVYNAFKKDEDASAVVIDGSLYIDTTANIAPAPALTVSVPNPTNDTLLEDAAVAALPDVRIQVIFTTFVAHNLASIVCLSVALPFFFWELDRKAAISILWMSCILQFGCYLGMIFARKKQPNLALGIYVTWVLFCSFITGCASSLLANIAPIQLMAMIWAEALVIIIYCKVSPHQLSTPRALVFMCIAAVAVWGICIAEFVIEHDWIAGTVILILGLGCAAYNAYQIRASEDHHYNTSWEDMVQAIVRFYGEPVILVMDKFCSN